MIDKSIKNKFQTAFNKVINMFTDITAERYIKELVSRYPVLDSVAESLDKVYVALKTCFVNDKTLFCAGNGGSAAGGTSGDHAGGTIFRPRHRNPSAACTGMIRSCLKS